MNPIKYDELIDKQIKGLTFLEKKEVLDYVEFLKIRKESGKNSFIAALEQSQNIGKQLGITEKDISKELRYCRKNKRG